MLINVVVLIGSWIAYMILNLTLMNNPFGGLIEILSGARLLFLLIEVTSSGVNGLKAFNWFVERRA